MRPKRLIVGIAVAAILGLLSGYWLVFKPWLPRSVNPIYFGLTNVEAKRFWNAETQAVGIYLTAQAVTVRTDIMVVIVTDKPGGGYDLNYGYPEYTPDYFLAFNYYSIAEMVKPTVFANTEIVGVYMPEGRAFISLRGKPESWKEKVEKVLKNANYSPYFVPINQVDVSRISARVVHKLFTPVLEANGYCWSEFFRNGAWNCVEEPLTASLNEENVISLQAEGRYFLHLISDEGYPVYVPVSQEIAEKYH